MAQLYELCGSACSSSLSGTFLPGRRIRSGQRPAHGAPEVGTAQRREEKIQTHDEEREGTDHSDPSLFLAVQSELTLFSSGRCGFTGSSLARIWSSISLASSGRARRN